MSLAKGLSILFIFSKNQLLVLLMFTFVSFISFPIISPQIFMISFLILILGVFVLLFSVVLCVKLGCLFNVFLVSWGRIVLLLTSLLEMLLLHPIGFELCFHCHLFPGFFFISLFISSVTCWLFRNVLLNIHVFVFLIVFFFSCKWYLVSILVVREDAWYDFNFLKCTEVWFVTQDFVYPGECSICTWEEGIFLCIWMECPEDINEIHLI